MFNTTVLRDTAFIVTRLFPPLTEERTNIEVFVGLDSVGVYEKGETFNVVYATYGKYAAAVSLTKTLLQEHASERTREDNKIKLLNE